MAASRTTRRLLGASFATGYTRSKQSTIRRSCSLKLASAAMYQANADRNLLLAILAHQNAFVTRDDLLAGMQAWLYDKDASLAEILYNQGALDAPRRQLLEALVEQHVQQHGRDPARSLQAVNSSSAV